MKKAIAVALFAAIICSFTLPAYADAGSKLQAGVKHFFMSPKQVSDAVIAEVDKSEGIPAKSIAVVGGFFKGVFYAVKDMGQGVYETLTFFVAHGEYTK